MSNTLRVKINIKYEYVDIEADKGDIAFVDTDSLHSSDTNVTADQVRYTAQISFNQIDKEDYRPVHIKPEYPVYFIYKK